MASGNLCILGHVWYFDSCAGSDAGSYQTEASNYGVAKFLQIQHAAALANREAENGVEAGLVLASEWNSHGC